MQDMTESFVKMNGLEDPIFNLLYEMLLLYIDFRFYIISFGLRIFCRDVSCYSTYFLICSQGNKNVYDDIEI